jgi:hypothetical protein
MSHVDYFLIRERIALFRSVLARWRLIRGSHAGFIDTAWHWVLAPCNLCLTVQVDSIDIGLLHRFINAPVVSLFFFHVLKTKKRLKFRPQRLKGIYYVDKK